MDNVIDADIFLQVFGHRYDGTYLHAKAAKRRSVRNVCLK